jgi:hypothetical protein
MPALVDRMIENLVSPQGLAKLVGYGEGTKNQIDGQPESDRRFHYENISWAFFTSLTRFEVQGYDMQNENGIIFVFQLSDFTWKLQNVIFDLSFDRGLGRLDTVVSGEIENAAPQNSDNDAQSDSAKVSDNPISSDHLEKGNAESQADKQTTNQNGKSDVAVAIPVVILRNSPNVLVKLWYEANEQCRGGHGNLQSTLDACDERETYGKRLDALKWCYGREGEYGYQMNWHVCD